MAVTFFDRLKERLEELSRQAQQGSSTRIEVYAQALAEDLEVYAQPIHRADNH
ncbi:MAG: hypothetical protein ABSG41_26410 [Bryobacteraceae bacterium]|jgi:hypothetical protein